MQGPGTDARQVVQWICNRAPGAIRPRPPVHLTVSTSNGGSLCTSRALSRGPLTVRTRCGAVKLSPTLAATTTTLGEVGGTRRCFAGDFADWAHAPGARRGDELSVGTSNGSIKLRLDVEGRTRWTVRRAGRARAPSLDGYSGFDVGLSDMHVIARAPPQSAEALLQARGHILLVPHFLAVHGPRLVARVPHRAQALQFVDEHTARCRPYYFLSPSWPLRLPGHPTPTPPRLREYSWS
ncbi:hypothetical protein GGX14DRAFT_610878 [Mycena pura]|uniref:DUF7330 domain-containing protein n=1 Tax=Mycena pura TaxID=153505 RepID=A0AAD6VMH2_9AGAR|nr:hypothetical protein GGX14DRAFT_610878 [Mycena pura]